jgi:hypothetical protein
MLPPHENAPRDAHRMKTRILLRRAWAVGLLLVGALLLWCGGELVRALTDPGLGGPRPAAQSWRWHRALSGPYADWAEARIGGAAAALPLHDVSGTEWPLFGTVFFLRATENLDRAWRQQPVGERPALYARRAIDAAAALLVDPAQSAWVQQYWGADAYLRRENVFYRMLLIDGLAAHAALTGDARHHALLRAQATTLAAELDASATGLLADYPGQIFPADVAAAWYAIRRADAVLGTDHSAPAARGLRAMQGALASPSGLPPYAFFGETNPEPTEVRGSANAWLMHNAAFVWPEAARAWQRAIDAEFRHASFWLAGQREFARSHRGETYADVDSGAVIAELGTAASAFGVGAARIVGAHADARAIALQMIAASWPLPNGRLLAPRAMSDLSDAPLLGEAAIVYNLSLAPAPGFDAAPGATTPSPVPAVVWLALGLQLGLGAAGVWRGFVRWRRAARMP